MILICPSCGATHSAEAWENDTMARQALQASCALPPEISKVCLGYLSLFRPRQRALAWSKSLRILNELSALVAPGHVQVQGKPARPCPPRIWALAMEQMVERSATLQRPLKNHNYLRQIGWQLADQADSGREKQVRQAEKSGVTKVNRSGDDEMSPAMRRYIEENGDPLATPAMQDMMQRMKARQGEFNAEQE